MQQRPKTLVPLDEDGATKLMKLIDTLEDLDDTDEVHANFDIDAEVLERVAGYERASRRRAAIFSASIVTIPLHSIGIAGSQCAHVISQPPCSRCSDAR